MDEESEGKREGEQIKKKFHFSARLIASATTVTHEQFSLLLVLRMAMACKNRKNC
jgi:hypothetical protein